MEPLKSTSSENFWPCTILTVNHIMGKMHFVGPTERLGTALERLQVDIDH